MLPFPSLPLSCPCPPCLFLHHKQKYAFSATHFHFPNHTQNTSLSKFPQIPLAFSFLPCKTKRPPQPKKRSKKLFQPRFSNTTTKGIYEKANQCCCSSSFLFLFPFLCPPSSSSSSTPFLPDPAFCLCCTPTHPQHSTRTQAASTADRCHSGASTSIGMAWATIPLSHACGHQI